MDVSVELQLFTLIPIPSSNQTLTACENPGMGPISMWPFEENDHHNIEPIMSSFTR